MASNYLFSEDSLDIVNTVIDGDSIATTVSFVSGEDSTSIIKGFKIRRGASAQDPYTGGGISCLNSGPKIVNNIIDENVSLGWMGAGISCIGSSPLIINNDIKNNIAVWSSGGGISCAEHSDAIILNNEISDNWAEFNGGGIVSFNSSPIIADNNVYSNIVLIDGGGISCFGGSAALIENNVIYGNTATFENGGGIFCQASNDTIIGNIISFNSAYDWGGGISCYQNTSIIMRCNLVINNSSSMGGGISCRGNSNVEIINCTLHNNSATSTGGGIYSFSSNAFVINAILWENSALEGAEIYEFGDPLLSVAFSDIQGGWPGEGNIDGDPLFAGGDPFDYNLQEDSPCIDAGDPDFPLDSDGSIVDMGAFWYDHGVDVPAQVPGGPGEELIFQQNGEYIGSIIVNNPGDLDSLRLIRYYVGAPGLDPDDPLVGLPVYYGAFAYPESAENYDLDVVFVYSDEELAAAGIQNESTLDLVRSEIEPIQWENYAGSTSIDQDSNEIIAHGVTNLSLWSIVGDPTMPPPCVYTPGDVNHNGAPLELADVIAMIGNYRGTVEPYYTCDCGVHGPEFAAVADPNGNCIAFELADVVTEIGAYRGSTTASGCPDCPGSLILFPRDEERLPVVPSLRPKVKRKENFIRD